MSFDKQHVAKMSVEIRRHTVDAIGYLGVGHIGGCLSIADVLAVLYYSQMRIDPKNPKMAGRDRFILSKGHGGPAVYSVLAMKGYFPLEELYTLNKLGTNLPSHCDMNRTIGIDMTTGSLGQGFSCAVGAAIASKIKKDDAYIYVVIGDGESQEGQIWEAAMLAAHRKLDNIVAFTDYNNMQIDGYTNDINSLGDVAAKWAAFGWDTQIIDGHDHAAINEAIELAKANKQKPSMIILKTIKGSGVDFIVDAGPANHNMTLNEEQTKEAMRQLAL